MEELQNNMCLVNNAGHRIIQMDVGLEDVSAMGGNEK